jgi:hypothetical protein
MRRPKHVMVSYNWGHQAIILRVVAALQARGYDVWVDVEQMKGSTVDTMALAVENAAVMVMGVSRAYKESTNCRLEAQYGMQREVEAVPLLLEEGYQADGWLGMMMGTKLWFGLYGDALSSESVFESRMEAVAFELGDRGRLGLDSEEGGVSMSVSAGDVGVELDEDLVGLRLSELQKMAKAAGVALELVEDALDAADVKLALISLIMGRRSEEGDASSIVPEQVVDFPGQATDMELDEDLVELKLSELRKLAMAMGFGSQGVEDTLDEVDSKAALISLIMTRRVEEAAGLAPDEQKLREELKVMKLKALKKRAKEVGVAEAKLEDADDADDVKSTVIELVVESMREQGCASEAISVAELESQQEERLRKLREELKVMKLKALKKRAKEVGVDEAKLEDVDDADDVKSTVIELIISREKAQESLTSANLKPHFSVGNGGASKACSESRLKSLFREKHCMFSYNWAEQEPVKAIRSQIAAAGCPTWMDVDGKSPDS